MSNSNTIGGVIANDFVSGGGSKRVSIRSSDAGFRTDDEYGIWTRTGNITPGDGFAGETTSREQSHDEIEHNRQLRRHRHAQLAPP